MTLCRVLMGICASELAVCSPPADLGQADIYSSGHHHNNSHPPHREWVAMFCSAKCPGYFISASWFPMVVFIKNICVHQFQCGFLPKRADMMSEGKKNEREEGRAVVMISRRRKSGGASGVYSTKWLYFPETQPLCAFTTRCAHIFIFIPFYFNTGTPGTHEEILLIPMTIKGAAY